MRSENNSTSFIPAVNITSPETDHDVYFIFCKNELLVRSQSSKVTIPYIKDLMNLELNNIQYIGALSGENFFCAQISEDAIIPNLMHFSTLKALAHQLTDEMFWIAGRAIQIVNWNNDHVYCGRCGTLTRNVDGQRAKQCPKCGLSNYPRISPAIIVAVIKNGKLLLAHNTQFPKDLYSVVSGFVEVGETFEQCVVREVEEETGIKVKNIEYFGNQPWPFPNSIMIGFTAEYESGEIQVDEVEISHANWYGPNELPVTPTGISIAKKLINWFVETF